MIDGWSQGDDDGFGIVVGWSNSGFPTARKPSRSQEWAVVCTNFGSLTLGLAASVESKNARSIMKYSHVSRRKGKGFGLSFDLCAVPLFSVPRSSSVIPVAP